ncbi:MAG: zf-HC2 domain-containing protein, partial [Candidatus Eremiobacteraeota bacterium]|nr:zf-HC2 domain-containing protein [Candidatus Eremiobacteraeota bacterium]
MTARDHLGEDAALYALGALDAKERHAVDEHVATCAPCAHALGIAESDVAAMAQAQAAPAVLRGDAAAIPIEPRRRSRWQPILAGAVAAALVVGLAPSA